MRVDKYRNTVESIIHFEKIKWLETDELSTSNPIRIQTRTLIGIV